ncbi:MAG: hypothetical protein K8S13_20950 [Desulfobacula sp.]|uniref:hypothetical protein n=1 Tax=Desulfobacula sp. TaxID=2593537 RepID=UPI0025C3536B|nr:hypothetical protein [Desulfobacula sp.]MCD4722302.1 hypothetical protein [Desulfobacula sp.]
MDFDSIVTFLFIIAFFVLPSIIKQVLARKKKTATPKKTKKKLSIFGRIGERIQQFIQELEEQAKQQKKETSDQEIIWETLSEEEESPPVFESVVEDADFSEPEPEVFKPPVKKRIQSRRHEQESCIKEPLYPLREKYCFKSNPLQNAIIWSEILSKPLALRDK